MPGQSPSPLIAGANPARPIDLLLVNAPLRDYSLRPRVNDFTLPVLGMAYIATYAAREGYSVGVIDAEAHGLGIAETAGIMWPGNGPVVSRAKGAEWLAPDINALPFVDRAYLARDPHHEKGRLQANMVGARGCPYNCSFCGAAVSANPDITIRVRTPGSILAEMGQLREAGATAFRFVDDLFLGHRRVIDTMTSAFTAAGTGGWAQWDATGRINVLNRLTDADLARTVVGRLTRHGISVKGYFILGCLIADGRYTADQLLNYSAVDLTSGGTDEALLKRGEFNFSVNLPLAEAPISHVRCNLIAVSREQWARFPAAS
jgi:anaerobic magnesium-protoporphyrin IX monomethyl ester cyclase